MSKSPRTRRRWCRGMGRYDMGDCTDPVCGCPQASNTEQAIDALIDAVKDGAMKPDRTWATAMNALLRRDVNSGQ